MIIDQLESRVLDLQRFNEEDPPEASDIPEYDSLPESVMRNGVEITREQMSESLDNFSNANNWQTKLTQQSQDLAEKEKANSQATEVQTFLNDHPEVSEKVMGLIDQTVNPVQEGVDPKIQEQLQKMQSVTEKVESQQLFSQLKEDWATLEKRYPSIIEKDPQMSTKLINYMREKGTTDMVGAFKVMNFDAMQTLGYSNGVNDRNSAQVDSRKLGTAGGAPGVVKPFNPIGKTDEQISNAIMNDPEFQ